MTTKRDFDEGNRFLTGDDLHRSILIKKIDGHKQGLQDILQTASATKIPTGLRTNFNDFDIENNLDKEVFDAATRKFWKDLESLSSRSKSSPRKLKKVQENEVKEQDKNNGKEEVLKEKGQEEVGINSARNHKYIRKGKEKHENRVLLIFY